MHVYSSFIHCELPFLLSLPYFSIYIMQGLCTQFHYCNPLLSTCRSLSLLGGHINTILPCGILHYYKPIRSLCSTCTYHVTSHLSMTYVGIQTAVRSHDWRGTNYIPSIFPPLPLLAYNIIINEKYVWLLRLTQHYYRIFVNNNLCAI